MYIRTYWCAFALKKSAYVYSKIRKNGAIAKMLRFYYWCCRVGCPRACWTLRCPSPKLSSSTASENWRPSTKARASFKTAVRTLKKMKENHLHSFHVHLQFTIYNSFKHLQSFKIVSAFSHVSKDISVINGAKSIINNNVIVCGSKSK